MHQLFRALSKRLIRSRPRPTEYFVARVIAWGAVAMAVTTGIGLIIVAVRLA